MDKKNIYQESLDAHLKSRGKLETGLKIQLNTKHDLSLYYTPGVAEPCRKIAEDPSKVYDYTFKGNTVLVVSDGSAVLGLGNIGPKAALPVMEGKCALFKKFGDVDAFPIVLDTQDTEEIIKTVKNIAPGVGGINLEDISAPRCFEIERRLIEELDIPVFHDDQHGTAIVILSGLINALKVVEKKKENVKIVINGAGAAGLATCKLLLKYGFKNISILDSIGLIFEGRENLNEEKLEFAKLTNRDMVSGDLSVAIQNADIFIGVSKPKLLTQDMVKTMAKDFIIFAMANPEPEIMPDLALEAGARIVATGRSDFPNQINNVLVFPGLFRMIFDKKIRQITDKIKIEFAEKLATRVGEDELCEEKIVMGVV